MKKNLLLASFLFGSILVLRAQENVDANDLKIEVEPGLFFNNGRSLNVLYNVTQDNNLGLGLYLMTSDVPEQIHKNMFTNITDSTNIRVSTEVALNFRYRIKAFQSMESNPYVGAILGWENLRLTKPGLEDLNISTFILTPHIGYEIYLYKRMLYINPQVRAVFYLGTNKSDGNRLESLKSNTFIPSISVGFRL